MRASVSLLFFTKKTSFIFSFKRELQRSLQAYVKCSHCLLWSLGEFLCAEEFAQTPAEWKEDCRIGLSVDTLLKDWFVTSEGEASGGRVRSFYSRQNEMTDEMSTVARGVMSKERLCSGIWARRGCVSVSVCCDQAKPTNEGFTRSEPFPIPSCLSCTYRPHFAFRHKFLPPKENTFHSPAIFTHEMWVTKHLLVENNIYVVGQLSAHHLKTPALLFYLSSAFLLLCQIWKLAGIGESSVSFIPE